MVLSLLWSQEMMDRDPESPPRRLAAVCVVKSEGPATAGGTESKQRSPSEGEVSEHLKEGAGFNKKLGVKCHC